jgi:UDP-glucose 4-epimerase
LNILITGASGFVGRAAAHALAAEGHRIVGTTTHTPAPEAPAIRWVHWDAATLPIPEVNWQEVEAVLHLAVPPDIFRFPGQARPLFETTVAATFHLLQHALSLPRVRRVVIASTGSVLAPGNGPAREDDVRYQPASFYGAAKACAELLCRAYEGLVSTAVLRLYHPYGPGGGRFLVNRVLDAVRNGREVCIEGESGILLNPVWIEDAAAGISRAMQSQSTGIFHIGGPETISFRNMLDLMGDLTGVPPLIRVLPHKFGEPHACRFDRSTTELGFQPRVGLRAGLQKLLHSV